MAEPFPDHNPFLQLSVAAFRNFRPSRLPFADFVYFFIPGYLYLRECGRDEREHDPPASGKLRVWKSRMLFKSPLRQIPYTLLIGGDYVWA